jgi:hypothetical protein
MAVLSAADRVFRGRMLHQESVRFASEFWDVSDLLSYLTDFIEQISETGIDAISSGLEVGLGIRRMVMEKCLMRWGVDEQACFLRLDQALYRLHVNLHASHGVVTSEVHSTAAVVLQEIEIVRDSV